MNNVNNFQVAKVQSQGISYLLNFLPILAYKSAAYKKKACIPVPV